MDLVVIVKGIYLSLVFVITLLSFALNKNFTYFNVVFVVERPRPDQTRMR